MQQVTKQEAIQWLQDAISDPEGEDAWGKTALFILEKDGKAGLADSQVEEAIKWVEDAINHDTTCGYDESRDPGGLYAFGYLKSLLPGCDPKLPYVKVELTSSDGNVFAPIGLTQRCMRRAGVHPDVISEFIKAVTTSHSYDGALQTIMAWVDTF